MAAAAAPSSQGGGLSSSPTFKKKAFSALFQDRLPSEVVKVQAAVSTHRGEPAVVFNAADIAAVASPFRFTLVGKFSKGRPLLPELRKFFSMLDLKDSVSVGLLDARHVLLRFNGEADFLRVWARNVWYVHGCPMRVFKWSSKFHVDRESSLVPVWFRLPKLPIHLFAKPCLFHIVSCLGNPLFVDAATSSFIRPNVARVCVEVDLLKSLPSRVWVDMGDGDGFWQPLIPESLPKYCGFCYRHGHEEGHCHVKFPEMRVSKGPTLKVPGSAVELDDGGKLIASSKPLVGAGESLDAADGSGAAVLPGVEEPPVALEGAVSGMGSDAPLLPATEGAELVTLAQSQQPGLAGAVAPRALEQTLSGKLCSDALLLPATEGVNAEQIFSAQPQ